MFFEFVKMISESITVIISIIQLKEAFSNFRIIPPKVIVGFLHDIWVDYNIPGNYPSLHRC